MQKRGKRIIVKTFKQQYKTKNKPNQNLWCKAQKTDNKSKKENHKEKFFFEDVLKSLTKLDY